MHRKTSDFMNILSLVAFLIMLCYGHGNTTGMCACRLLGFASENEVGQVWERGQSSGKSRGMVRSTVQSSSIYVFFGRRVVVAKAVSLSALLLE